MRARVWLSIAVDSECMRENLTTAAFDLASLNWTASDTRNMRRMIAGQNLFYIRRLLDQLSGTGSAEPPKP